MPTISRKGILTPESPIRKLVPYAEAAEKRGIHIYHLNIGQPDIKTPQVALDAVKNNDIEILSYSTSNGSESYRDKLADYYSRNKINVSKDDILVTTGASEALLFTIACITDPHDEIIIPEPFYANYNSFAIAGGINVVPITTTIEEEFALPNISEFEKVITNKTKAILICNPGNPTGVVYSKKDINQLKELALKYDLFLIADEVYREFVYDDEVHYSILSEDGMDQHAIMIDSISKRFSMCGARIGCVVSKNKELLFTIMKMAQSRLSPPTYAQLAAEAALDTPPSYFEAVVKEYTERRDVLYKALYAIEGVTVFKPKGAFYCIASLPVEDTDIFAKWLLEEYSDNGETVMVAPASGFYTSEHIGKKQIRIAYVLNQKNLVRAVEILAKALKAYQSK
ncbi:pyridoxal phosphate-dependent aminotransferase [Flavicella sediminum]|uniref:pyridoxal phosphate-dependent aminotransferase n=1 Tax=Flavicella sediminum TaxID=2585141 RepID=UPI0011201F10|nr:pyridoxal phosphate-dependent aminotransferase [Flavicella sediminum]